MLKYREKVLAKNNEGTSAQTPADAADLDGNMPKYMSLAAQYGLDSDMEIGESGANEQTVEQEYQAYVTAPLSPKSINILKFWEVGIMLMIFKYY